VNYITLVDDPIVEISAQSNFSNHLDRGLILVTWRRTRIRKRVRFKRFVRELFCRVEYGR